MPDGVVEIPIAGAPNLRIAIEAKGSKHPITHVEINPATLEEHQKQLGCSRSVVVARRFQTEGRGAEGSVLLRITKEHNLPLITTSTIGGILRLHQQRPFTHPKLVRILTTWHDPEGLDAWVREIWQDSPDPGVLRLVLELAYDAQNKDSTNSPSPGMILVDDRIRKRKITTAQLAGILEAVQTTTGLLHIINPQTYEFELLQDPETIVEAMTKAHDEDLGKVSAAGSKSEPKG